MRPPDDTPVADLGLPARATNCLLRHGVRTTSDLLSLSDAQVLSLRNSGGRRQLLEVKRRLAELGYLSAAAVDREWRAFWNEPL